MRDAGKAALGQPTGNWCKAVSLAVSARRGDPGHGGDNQGVGHGGKGAVVRMGCMGPAPKGHTSPLDTEVTLLFLTV